MIISEPGERARHTSPTDTDTHGPQRKKTQCCGEKKDTNEETQLHKYTGKNKDTVMWQVQEQKDMTLQIHSNTQ